ncbi:MAG: hypothetical protein ACREO1_13740 [Arenimonas sp.]
MNKWLCGFIALGITQIALAGNYILKVDGTSYELDIGEEKTIQTKQGAVKVLIEKKAIATYTIDGVSFEHPSSLSPSVSVLSEEVKQVLLAEANGDSLMIQLYKGIDGSVLVPLLENELTKEEVDVGYKKTGKDVEIKLDNGDVLSGRFVKTEKGGDRYERYIIGCAITTGGIMAVIQTSDLEVEGQNKEGMMKTLKSLKANCVKN